MSPRSEEYMELARDRLSAARLTLERHPEVALSTAYSAALSAARAALSEEDRYAKTHRGVWDLFWQLFAETGRFDRALTDEARALQPEREAVDYEAQRVAERVFP